MDLETENKIIGRLAEIGVTFPITIHYPSGESWLISRRRTRIPTALKKKYTNNVIELFPNNIA